MKFSNAYNRNKTIPAPSGKKFRTTYAMKIDENGHKYLAPSGKTNVYATIQASLEESKIENIIAMCAMGDQSGLRKKVGEYLDITGMPTTLAEAQRAMQDVANQFYQLPLEIREAFNHSPEQYIASYGSEAWNNILKNYVEGKAADSAAAAAEKTESKSET